MPRFYVDRSIFPVGVFFYVTFALPAGTSSSQAQCHAQMGYQAQLFRSSLTLLRLWCLLDHVQLAGLRGLAALSFWTRTRTRHSGSCSTCFSFAFTLTYMHPCDLAQPSFALARIPLFLSCSSCHTTLPRPCANMTSSDASGKMLTLHSQANHADRCKAPIREHELSTRQMTKQTSW